jgi:hypothetical protein
MLAVNDAPVEAANRHERADDSGAGEAARSANGIKSRCWQPTPVHGGIRHPSNAPFLQSHRCQQRARTLYSREPEANTLLLVGEGVLEGRVGAHSGNHGEYGLEKEVG